MKNFSVQKSTIYETGRMFRLRRLQSLTEQNLDPKAEADRLLDEVENQPMTGTQIMMRAQRITEASM